jgi:hypothetical protein
VTTLIAAIVGVGVGGAIRAPEVAAAAVGTGSDGMKTSVGFGTGVTMRATVCRVARHVGRRRIVTPVTEATPRIVFQRLRSVIVPLHSGFAVDQ